MRKPSLVESYPHTKSLELVVYPVHVGLARGVPVKFQRTVAKLTGHPPFFRENSPPSCGIYSRLVGEEEKLRAREIGKVEMKVAPFLGVIDDNGNLVGRGFCVCYSIAFLVLVACTSGRWRRLCGEGWIGIVLALEDLDSVGLLRSREFIAGISRKQGKSKKRALGISFVSNFTWLVGQKLCNRSHPWTASQLIGSSAISGSHPSADTHWNAPGGLSLSDVEKKGLVDGQARELPTRSSLTDSQIMVEKIGESEESGPGSEGTKNGFLKESMTAGCASDLHRSGSLPVRGTVTSEHYANNLRRSLTYSEGAATEHFAASINNGPLDFSTVGGPEKRFEQPSPPAPPPSPPVTSGTVALTSTSIARKARSNWSCGSSCVPKEIVDHWDKLFLEAYRADVEVHTEDGGIVPVHSSVLASGSGVLRQILEDFADSPGPHCIPMYGVPYKAAKVFLRFLYSSRFEEEDMENFSTHLLVLAHAYCVPVLKRLCTQHYEMGVLNVENVIDILQLAMLCDAPRLHLLCYRLVLANFKTVSRTEAWKVMKTSNPQLEQELVEAVIESDYRKQEKSRKTEEDKVYEQLHDAMEALVHICKDGCRTIGPHDKVFDAQKKGDCQYPACKGLESLVRHFAGCKLKVSRGCVHCKRMWQLLELHSRMCEETACKVPLCGHFKYKIGQHQTKREETRWRLLVNKVLSAKRATSPFSLAAVSDLLLIHRYLSYIIRSRRKRIFWRHALTAGHLLKSKKDFGDMLRLASCTQQWSRGIPFPLLKKGSTST
ncbi:hypothetical protein R1flu_022270 [Riccia fluitans]|uniref:BTB/POZ and TAZ domain-containing protein 4 n=1 Tax=Riccia fluitans TaxID=41844 RepID=A0ABD1ZSJ7_9MARC